MSVLDGTVFDDQGVSLGAVASEDGGAIEGQVQRLGEAEVRVSQEADLITVSPCLRLARGEDDSLRWIRMDPGSWPMPSCLKMLD